MVHIFLLCLFVMLFCGVYGFWVGRLNNKDLLPLNITLRPMRVLGFSYLIKQSPLSLSSPPHCDWLFESLVVSNNYNWQGFQILKLGPWYKKIIIDKVFRYSKLDPGIIFIAMLEMLGVHLSL